MNAMERLASTLADMDDLLQQADDQTIDECLERGKDVDYDPPLCPSCGHAFHGLACPPPSQFASTKGGWFYGIDDYSTVLYEPGASWWSCTCQTSLPR